jgi:glycosyltransferase involved in cell wall biosynthesis
MARRIAFISGSYRPDRCGVADYTRKLAQTLDTAGYEPLVVTCGQAISVKKNLDPPIYRLTQHWGISSLPGFARRLVELRPDIVHIQHSASSYGHSRALGLLPLALRMADKELPLVTTAHEYGGWDIRPPLISPLVRRVGRWLEQRGLADREDFLLLSSSRAVIVTNQFHFDYMTSHIPGIASRVHLVPIGPNVVPSQTQRDSARHEALAILGLHEPVKVMCYFGFIHPVKGLETLLRAMREVIECAGHPVHLAIVGGVQNLSLREDEAEEYRRNLINLRDELGLTDVVTFTGYIDARRVSALLQAADLAVLPFNHGASLKSGSLLAALAHGLPVITTRTEATSAELRDGENVLLVPPLHQSALVSRIMSF